MGADPFVTAALVWQCAGRAILHAAFRICKVSAAAFAQCVQRAIAEHTVKTLGALYLVAGEIPAIFVLKNDVNFPCFYLNS